MATISDRTPAIAIEYTARGKRTTKDFENANDAKRFYAAKLKAGKSPAVVAGDAAAVVDAKDEEKQEPTDAVDATAAANPAPTTTSIKVPGVAATATTRAYYAGVVIARHGHAAGVTQEMVAEVDALYGRAKPVESEICLRNAWHCLRGAGVADALATPAAASAAPANA